MLFDEKDLNVFENEEARDYFVDKQLYVGKCTGKNKVVC